MSFKSNGSLLALVMFGVPVLCLIVGFAAGFIVGRL